MQAAAAPMPRNGIASTPTQATPVRRRSTPVQRSPSNAAFQASPIRASPSPRNGGYAGGSPEQGGPGDIGLANPDPHPDLEASGWHSMWVLSLRAIPVAVVALCLLRTNGETSAFALLVILSLPYMLRYTPWLSSGQRETHLAAADWHRLDRHKRFRVYPCKHPLVAAAAVSAPFGLFYAGYLAIARSAATWYGVSLALVLFGAAVLLGMGGCGPGTTWGTAERACRTAGMTPPRWILIACVVASRAGLAFVWPPVVVDVSIGVIVMFLGACAIEEGKYPLKGSFEAWTVLLPDTPKARIALVAYPAVLFSAVVCQGGSDPIAFVLGWVAVAPLLLAHPLSAVVPTEDEVVEYFRARRG